MVAAGAAENDVATRVYHEDNFFGAINISNFMFGAVGLNSRQPLWLADPAHVDEHCCGHGRHTGLFMNVSFRGSRLAL